MTDRTNMPPSFIQQITDARPSLLALARRLTRDGAHAEDLVQDTMMLALRFGSSYTAGTNLGAWLRRILKNRFISTGRRHTLEQKVANLEGRHALRQWCIGQSSRQQASPEELNPAFHPFSDPVQHAINALKPAYRDAVLMCDVEGLSYQEAAGALTCPVGTIMSRLHRGRKALRNQLGSQRQLAGAA